VLNWTIDHWQWVTGAGGLATTLVVLWRGAAKLAIAKWELTKCRERERVLIDQETFYRERVASFARLSGNGSSGSAANTTPVATPSSE
jgi:hypothetical protein